MRVRSFRAKLLILLLGVLLLLAAATLAAVHLAGERMLRKSVAEELGVGSRVLDDALATRGTQLSEMLHVLAYDFGFRDAVASADIDTIESALSNAGSRVEADFVFLISLDGIVQVDTSGSALEGQPFPIPELWAEAETERKASGIASFRNRPYQLAMRPVLGPQPIAWICAGFEIGEATLKEVSGLTSLDVSLWSSNAAGTPNVISTHSPEKRDQLLAATRNTRATSDTQTTLQLGNSTFATMLHPLATSDGSRVNALLQRDLEAARESVREMEMYTFIFSIVVLLLAVAAAIAFSRTVTRPLQTLAEGAGRVERGDYVSAIAVEQEDEIGRLATAFNAMQLAIAAREEQITHQASHDALTGLPNRTLFLDRLTSAIAAGKRSGATVGIVMMDVDRFKEINDTLGHNFGDQLLIEIGRRLSQTLPAHETVARLGGDEFAVRFTAPDASRADEIVRHFGAAFEAPFVLGDVPIEVNASLGIATFPRHAEDADTLLKRAEVAMYDAKKNQSGFAWYEAGRDEYSLRRLTLMMELRQAIGRDELEIFFQPKIDVASRRPVHAEALVRWNHPRHGRMAPDEFIPLAEQSGNIPLITRYVLRGAIRKCAEWERAGISVKVAVNLSALDLFDAELPTYITGLLSEAGVSSTRLVLEITESAVMKDASHALKVLRDLKHRGVSLAIDDFGTGYSSLAHLKRLPVDELKIDKSFVLNLADSTSDDFVIVRSTIELGHNMGLTVVAEGVESAEALRLLHGLGCDMAQGYYVSKPLPADLFVEWMEAAGRPA